MTQRQNELPHSVFVFSGPSSDWEEWTELHLQSRHYPVAAFRWRPVPLAECHCLCPHGTNFPCYLQVGVKSIYKRDLNGNLITCVPAPCAPTVYTSCRFCFLIKLMVKIIIHTSGHFVGHACLILRVTHFISTTTECLIKFINMLHIISA